MSTPREKKHLESKKFVAFLISELTWKLLIALALIAFKDELTTVSNGLWWLLMAIVVTAGFTEVGFILGQAALDKYVRVAEIAADEVRHKLEGKPAPTDPPTDPGVQS